METAFAKIVDTPMGEAISLEGNIVFIQAPDGKHGEIIRAIVTGLRRQSRETGLASAMTA